MTRRLELTADEWAAVQAGGWLVMPSPADLVDAAAPCETCGGRRWHPSTSPDEPGAACTHCRITLLGECPTCGGIGGYAVMVDGEECRHGACRTCGGDRENPRKLVTLGYAYAVSEVLPVLSDRGWFAVDLADNVIVVMDRRAFRVPTLAESSEEITDALAPYGDPAALVGQYALRLEVVP